MILTPRKRDALMRLSRVQYSTILRMNIDAKVIRQLEEAGFVTRYVSGADKAVGRTESRTFWCITEAGRTATNEALAPKKEKP